MMETNSIQKELLLTSYLFEYPSKEWWGDVKECAAEAHTVERPQSREVLLRDRLIEAKLPYAFLLDVVLTGAAHLEGRTAS